MMSERASVAVSPAPTFVLADDAHCRRQPGLIARLALPDLADRAHVLSAAAICFARGVNDTPKLAALLLAGQVMAAPTAVILIAAVMAAGGLIYARRVAETMSQRVTRLDHGPGPERTPGRARLGGRRARIHEPPNGRPEQPVLVHRLGRTHVVQLGRPIGRDHQQGYGRLVGLHHRRVQLNRRGAAGGEHHRRHARRQAQP